MLGVPMFLGTIEITQYLIVATVAFIASVIGGVAGYGTGLLLPPVLVPIIGAEAVVPVIGLSALLTNSSRLMAFRADFDFSKFKLIALWGVPTTIAGAYGYTLLTGPMVTVLIGAVLIVLIPVRRVFAKRRQHLSDRGVTAAGIGYGLLNGGTAGSGVMLLSILLGAGLSGTAVIATDAGISLVLGTFKSLTFFGAGALPGAMIVMALLIGLCAMPGAFLAKKLALKLTGQAHVLILDAVVILGGVILIWRGLAG